MAKKSSIEKNNRRLKKALKYREIRTKLREMSVNFNLSEKKRMEAQMKLQSLSRDTSICRVIRRCYITGRARGNLRKFGLSRIIFRDMASNGRLPGVTKASW